MFPSTPFQPCPSNRCSRSKHFSLLICDLNKYSLRTTLACAWVPINPRSCKGRQKLLEDACVFFLQLCPLFLLYLGRRENVQPCITQCFPLAQRNPGNVSASHYGNGIKDLQCNGEQGLQLGRMCHWASQPGWSTFTGEDFKGSGKMRTE